MRRLKTSPHRHRQRASHALTGTLLLAAASLLSLAGCQDSACHSEPDERGDEACAQTNADAGATAPDSGPPAAALSYCNCLLIRCHDPFHDRFGVSDEDALTSCAAEATSTATSTLECQSAACQAAMCEDALGTTCM